MNSQINSRGEVDLRFTIPQVAQLGTNSEVPSSLDISGPRDYDLNN